MSEPESDPRKTTSADLPTLLEGVKVVAASEIQEVDATDNRALECEDDLLITGQTWLQQEFKHTKHLHYVRLVLLAALFILVITWLLSIAGLLIMIGFRVWDFALTDKIVIAYMTSTTVSVLGLFHIAAKWLFSASFADLAGSIKSFQK